MTITNGGSISTTQFTGNLRLNASRGRFQPFATGGVGWEMLHRTGPGIIGVSDFRQTVYSVVTPFSGGFTGYVGQHTVVELRGTYNLITSKDFATGGARPDMWSGELRFGYASE